VFDDVVLTGSSSTTTRSSCLLTPVWWQLNMLTSRESSVLLLSPVTSFDH